MSLALGHLVSINDYASCQDMTVAAHVGADKPLEYSCKFENVGATDNGICNGSKMLLSHCRALT